MSRPKPAVIFAFLAVVIAVLGGVSLVKGGFYIAKHEGDTLHLLQIVFRMADGEWPHLDFMTPIGIMAFLPIVAFVKFGAGIGMAILLSQILVALVLLPALFWTVYSRFDNALAYLFGLAVLVLVLALVHGEADRSVSISMHYNRWAWATAYVVIALAVLPGTVAKSDVFDGTVIGLGMAFLLLCKVTYFIAFAPAVIAALLLRSAWRVLGLAFGAGIVAVAVMTAFSGVGFWLAYLGDLQTVANSEVRPQPGAPLKIIIGSPAYLGGSLALMTGVILLRQAGERVLGLVLLLLVPGFFYVTYQNFGNDPQWLMLLAILLLVPRPDPAARNGLGWPLGRALALTAMAAIAFAAPSFLNLAYSPFRHAGISPSDYTPMLARSARHNDLFDRVVRSNRVDGTIALDGPGSGLESRQDLAKRAETHAVFQGEDLPDCELQLGLIAWFETIVADLEANGFGGKRLIAADIFSSHWLFGDVLRLTGGAPWYYGGLPGLDSAEIMLVPMCPASLSIRKQVLDEISERGLAAHEVRRAPLYILYDISGS
ncbi:MAG: hypothetical protein LJE68_15580 [Rhodobacter sp.]|nr:hypothetical protein [Rhodobacter sp.]